MIVINLLFFFEKIIAKLKKECIFASAVTQWSGSSAG